LIEVIRESKRAPEEFQKRLALKGGRNFFGEPNYRVVWGWSRLSWLGGKWSDRDASGNVFREVIELREEPKYFMKLNRWIVERWFPPEFYGSPRYWDLKTVIYEDGIAIPALGPYPSRGDYEEVFTVEAPNEEFVQLTPQILDECVMRLQFGQERYSTMEKVIALEARQEQEKKEHDDWAMDLLDDAFDAFYGAPNTTQANAPYTREGWEPKPHVPL
jgi:hypothetical protein